MAATDTLQVLPRDIARWHRDLTAMRASIDGMLLELSAFLPQGPAAEPKELLSAARAALARQVPGAPEAVSDDELAEQAKKLLAEERMRKTVQAAAEMHDEPKPPARTRVSFGALCRRIAMDHGTETLQYAVEHCGVDRTAMRLKQVMSNFLGVFRTNVEAGHAFCKASGTEDASDADAVAALADAIHKVSVPGRGLAVWANNKKQLRRQQPGEVSAGQRDPSHAWHKMVEQAQKSDHRDDEETTAEPGQIEETEAMQASSPRSPERLSDDDIAAFC